MYKNYIPDKSNYGLAIHFSIQILLAKFSNKNLDYTLVEKINAYIKTICPEQDEAAYSHAYFLASSVNHELLDQIFLQNQVNKIFTELMFF